MIRSRRRRLARTVALVLALLVLTAGPAGAAVGPGPSGRALVAQTSETVNIYFIALEDNGRSGPPVGCGDSVVPVQVQIDAGGSTVDRITRALNALLAVHDQHYGQSGLYNALYQSRLTVQSVDVSGPSAVVRLAGTLQLGGTCDVPRASAQLSSTVLQFPGITSVSIVYNNQTLNPSPAERVFPQTGHTLQAGFRSYWEKFGGLPVFGYPLTEEFEENGVRVQYFERARFEWHPGAAPARFDVLLGLLGDELTAGRAGTGPFARIQTNPNPGQCTYYPQTGHTLCAGFRAYWQKFGGLAIYGYPISQEFVENGVTVQYFERARFEWHPGAWPARYDVLLGRAGVEVLAQRDPGMQP